MPYLNNKFEENYPQQKKSDSSGNLGLENSSITRQNNFINPQGSQGGKDQSSGELKKEGSVSVLGDFEMHHKLGQGNMGVVYRGRQISLDRPVAIKVLPRSIASDKSFVKRFELEAKAIARISSLNVVQVYGAGNHEGQEFFAMEYVEGRDLGVKLKNGARLSFGESLDIIKQVALGLVAAAEHGIIHRDIKPSNIMITNRGVVKIMDFGLVKLRGREEAGLTMAGTLLGTANYQSPEQGRGGECDKRSDLYSLGVVFYQLVTGKLPFSGDSPTSIIYQHNCVEPRKPKTIEPAIPEDIQRIILKCMGKEPENRYQHPKEIVSAIEDLADRNFDDPPPSTPQDGMISPKEGTNSPPKKSDSKQTPLKNSHLKSQDSLSEKQSKRSRLSTLVIGSSITLLIGAMYFPLYLNRQAPLSIEEAQDLLENQIYFQCREVIEANLHSSPNDPDWLSLKRELNFRESRSILRVAASQIKRNNFDAAKANVFRVMKLNPKNSQGETLMTQLKKRDEERGDAIQLMEAGNFLKCRSLIKGKLEQSPKDQGWTKLERELDSQEGSKLLQEVSTDYEKKDFKSAELNLKKALILVPNNEQARDFERIFSNRKNQFAVARQHLTNKNFAKSREVLRANLEVDSEDPKWLQFQGDLNATEGEAILTEAKSMFSKGDYSQAKNEIKKALELIPYNDTAKNLSAVLRKRDQTLNQAEELLNARQFSEGRALIEEQLLKTPSDNDWGSLRTELNNREGQLFLEKAKEGLKLSAFSLARKASQKTLELLPENVEAGKIIEFLDKREKDLIQVKEFFNTNELSRSRELIDSYLNSSPNDEGWIKMREQLLLLEGLKFLTLAQVELKNGNYVLARKLAFQGIQSDPNNGEARTLIDKIDKREQALSKAREYLANGNYLESRDLQKRNILHFPGDQDWLNLEKEINKAEGNSLLLRALADYEQENYLSAETSLLRVAKLLPDNEYSKKLLEQIKIKKSSVNFDFEPLRLTSSKQSVKSDDPLAESLPQEDNDSNDLPVVSTKIEPSDIPIKGLPNHSTEDTIATNKNSSSPESLAILNAEMGNRINELSDLIGDKSCTIMELDQAMKAFMDTFGENHEESKKLLSQLEDRRQEKLFQHVLEEIDQSIIAKDKERLTYFIKLKEHLESLNTFIDQSELLFQHSMNSFERTENRANADVTVNFSFHNMPETEIRYHYEAELKGDEWVIIAVEMLENWD